ncbi:MAG: NAD-dependent protein deacylase [Candidatus Hatepunaea meridiana]|nr:NAD-dependent protein deacylase [Candidatus Hatepunaea meridiana]
MVNSDIPDNTQSDSHQVSDKDITSLKELMDEANRIVIFTGAGISAESGIATYRGHGGIWTKYDAEKYASIDYFRRDPSYYWNFFKDVRHDMMADAQPSASHIAVAELERQGRVSSIITQNIDNLHYKAGSKRVLELHGNTTRFYCCDCRAPYTMTEAKNILDERLPPLCLKCSGVLRPDVVLFGEMLPADVIDEAHREAQMCDLMIVIGSSLVVYPAANLPYQAKSSGAKLVIINIDPTPLDSVADLYIHRPAGEVFPQAAGMKDE